jgi:hypothetical protein
MLTEQHTDWRWLCTAGCLTSALQARGHGPSLLAVIRAGPGHTLSLAQAYGHLVHLR